MTTFYICRHGQTENNRKQLLSGWIDTPLTDSGLRDAQRAAGQLQDVRIDAIVSSDLGRAFMTAYDIARAIGYEGEIRRFAGLRDINYGEFANRPYTGPDNVYPDVTPEENTTFIVPGGESLALLQERVMGCLADIAREFDGKSVLIVAHDGTINAIRAAQSGQLIGIVDAGSNNAHGGIYRFTYDDGGMSSLVPLKPGPSA